MGFYGILWDFYGIFMGFQDFELRFCHVKCVFSNKKNWVGRFQDLQSAIGAQHEARNRWSRWSRGMASFGPVGRCGCVKNGASLQCGPPVG